ncbi:MAG: tRNA (adenosine(37)-N6)-threonylcarbamoyltransferase complex transferase subunit TsaD [Neomegalonema sp.]|nr:tRNA (adenosine(37)-N6)-threonylcarbamoyltransferase complex transferase subunit TsaD [Neomegalonema sp.]
MTSPPPLTILGVESTCDETAIALVRGRPAQGGATDGEILANIVMGQAELHQAYGGVVPEIAARAHVERLDVAMKLALEQADLTLDAVDAVAVAAGPGLIGGVSAGLVFAKAVAAARGAPFFAINHLEAHALSPRLAAEPDGPAAFPFLLLLASGGHCQLIAVLGHGRYKRLGGTIDDSPGEAFDKIGQHLGLPFPGGPHVERAAAAGDPNRFALPRPLSDRPGCDMSFSGLKTALRLEADKLIAAQGGLREQDVADLCASFQLAVCDSLAQKTARAATMFAELSEGRPACLAVAGGVAANQTLRTRLRNVAAEAGLTFAAPPLSICTDNGAMIAWAAMERRAAGGCPDELAAAARARWPLDPDAAPMLGSGKHGAKA